MGSERMALLARGGEALAPLRCDCPAVPGVSGRRYEDRRRGMADPVLVCDVCGCERPLTTLDQIQGADESMLNETRPESISADEWRRLLEAERQAHLGLVDAIERALGTSPRTSELRKAVKAAARERAA